jgi:hypothetical protein
LPGSPTVAFMSQGQMDSDLPGVRVYASGPRALVLADLGSEGSWGVGVYEVTPDSVRALGILDVGRPQPDSIGDPDWTAIDLASVRRLNDRWQIEFDSTVVLRPNQRPPDREVLQDFPVAFEFRGGDWRRVDR